jgi:L-amino acid N-acyltransferase YncA
MASDSKCRGEMTMHVRPAELVDAPAIAEIYNQGIEDRVATFETRLRSAEDVVSWFDGVHPIIVAEEEGKAVAFAATSNYRPRDCYQGIAEASVYVARIARCRGAGRAVLQALITACERAGYWKLVSRVFPENGASRRLIGSLGFREIGIYEKHGQLDGAWRDVIIVERLLTGAMTVPATSDLAAAVTAAASHELTKALDRIKHCLAQLADEQVWQRPSESMNSIGNLILHLCGNLRQWIVAGIGGEPDVRQRPMEFSERGPISMLELVRRLDEVVAHAHDALKKSAAQDLLRQRCIQGFDVNGLEAIFDSVPHFRGHAQEIVHMTRSLLGDAYKFAWAPSTLAEGA